MGVGHVEYNSAGPIKSKITTLTQEVIRRMRNTARRATTQARICILTKFILKMKRSEYPDSIIQTILEAGLTGYYRMVKAEAAGTDRINRAGSTGIRQREINNIVGKCNWFIYEQEDGEETTISSKDNSSKVDNLKSSLNGRIENPSTTETKFYTKTETVICVPSTPQSQL